MNLTRFEKIIWWTGSVLSFGLLGIHIAYYIYWATTGWHYENEDRTLRPVREG